ncbi:TatD family hydrolase [Patescibacteria group bacterium]|nr:TatD family hydrolase [Patescibacteria group bacterium]
MFFIDTHSHLNLPEFSGEIKEVISRAKEAGLSHIIVPGIDLATSKLAYGLANEFDIIYPAAGFHPNHIQNADIASMEKIAELISKPEIVAIGEIGLDYYRNTTDPAEQRKIFQYLLSLASSEAKPVIIHSRASDDDVLEILNMYKSEKIRGVWHCFESSWETASRILDLGFYLGFTGNITYSKNEELIEVVQKTPLEKIVIETDSPYLAPLPYRGQQNEPGYVVEVARKISEIKNAALEVIAQTTTENAVQLFNL